MVFQAPLESQETCEFMGFTPKVAHGIWERYSTLIAEDPQYGYGLLHFAMGYMDAALEGFYTSAEDDWDGGMLKIGLTQQLRSAILMPEFTDIRCTAELHTWLRIFLEESYLHIYSLGEGRDTTKGGRSIEAKPSMTWAQVAVMGVSKLQIPVSEGTTNKTPPTRPGHTTLWRACTIDRACQLYNEKDGSWEPHHVSVSGDFSRSYALC